MKLDRLFLQEPLEHLAVVDVQAQHETVRGQDTGSAIEMRSLAWNIDQRRMSGPRVRHRPSIQIDDGVCHGDEAASIEIGCDDVVRGHHQIARRCVDSAEREHQPLQFSHVATPRTSLCPTRLR